MKKNAKGSLKFAKMAKSAKVGEVASAEEIAKLTTKYAPKIVNIARTTSGQGKLTEDSTHGDRWTPEEEEYLKYACEQGKGYNLVAGMLKRDSTVGPWAHAKSMGLKMSKTRTALTTEEEKVAQAFVAQLVAKKVVALKAGKVHPNHWSNGK